MSKEVTTTEQRAKEYDERIHQLAMDTLKNEWGHLYVGGSYPSRPYPANYNMALSLWIRGYKAALASSPDAGDWKSVEDGLRTALKKLIEDYKHLLSEYSRDVSLDLDTVRDLLSRQYMAEQALKPLPRPKTITK